MTSTPLTDEEVWQARTSTFGELTEVVPASFARDLETKLGDERRRVEELEIRLANTERDRVGKTERMWQLGKEAEQAESRAAALWAALERIANPVAWEQNNLQPGYKIDGPMLQSMLNQPSYYQEIARKAIEETPR